jgi:hypothetical protein
MSKVCSVEGCESSYRMRRGWCSAHYQRLRPRPTCKYLDCTNPAVVRGVCDTHRQREDRGAFRVEDLRRRPPGSTLERRGGNKWCTRCETWKGPEEFSPNKRFSDGLSTWCRPCFNRRTQERKYNLPRERWVGMLATQKGLCDICSTPITDCWRVDHDHACCPGAKSCGLCIRGLLCPRCNSLLGMAADSGDVLRRAVKYLEEWELSRG